MRRFFGIVPGSIVLLLLSVSLNVALAGKVKTLRGALAALKSEASLKVGESITDLNVTDRRGVAQLVRFADVNVPTILYVFSPTCSWCARNKENVRVMAEATRGRFRVVGLSLTETKLTEYIAEQQIAFPVYLVPEALRVQLKLGGTPQTLVVDTDGRLQKNWRGAYMGALEADVESSLGLSLPGLLAAAAPKTQP